MTGVFLKRGEYTDPLNHEKLWDFTPLAKAGDKVVAADWLGEVKEGWLPHKIMVPFSFKGEYTVKSVAPAGQYNIDAVVSVLLQRLTQLKYVRLTSAVSVQKFIQNQRPHVKFLLVLCSISLPLFR